MTRRCARCVLSASFPRITFDEEGVCNYCRRLVGTTTDNTAVAQARKKLDRLLSKYRGHSDYDAVLCFSGGKDSTYVMMRAVQDYELHVLAFTLDNGFVSRGALENIQRVTDHLGVDHVIFRPAAKHFEAIVRASALSPIYSARTLTRISAVCNSCISMVNTLALRLALEKNIPFIVAGFNLGQIPTNAIIYRNNYRFLRQSREAALERLRKEAGSFVDDYFSLNERLTSRGRNYPYNVNLLCLEDAKEEDILDVIRLVGWETPDDVDGCSSNCRLNTFNNLVHEKMCGYNPYELELSDLVRRGLLSRDQALEKIRSQPIEQFEAVKEALGLDDTDFPELLSAYG